VLLIKRDLKPDSRYMAVETELLETNN